MNAFIEKSNSLDVTVGPRIFLQCPLDVLKARAWFIARWNDSLVPYMEKVAKEGPLLLPY